MSAPRGRTPAEWFSFWIAAAILTVLIGLVVYDWLTSAELPPEFAIERGEPTRRADGRFYVPFSVTNRGGETAASVRVEAKLVVGGRPVETGEQEIDFLAGGERESGSFVFSRDPDRGRLNLRVTGYGKP